MLVRMGREGMRAGDQDRQQVADQLKSALDEGRLDLDEYDERVQRAYAARTYGDLDGLLDDLPGTIPVRAAQVEPATQAPSPVAKGGPDAPRRSGASGMFGVFVICTLVWALTSMSSGEMQYFWPGWVLIPLVLAVLAHFNNRGKRHH